MSKFDAERMNLYLGFVDERHHVWEERQVGAPAPWTSDPILASKKFTNVFRVLDPGSQFIFELAKGCTPADFLLRCFLYRHTGRTEAWEFLRDALGEYPVLDDLDEVLMWWREYRAAGNPVFTGAYLVYPQSSSPGTDKLESIIRLTQRLFDRESLAEEFLQAKDQPSRFGALRRHKGVADFMSMQILTDWGYGPFAEGDLENDFVVPGPGCRKGIMTITDTPHQLDFLRFAHSEVLASDDVPMLSLSGGGSRVPSIMDVQNTLCEFSKYVRYLSRGTAAKPYIPAHPGQQPDPVLPAHWANNDSTIGTRK
jgi:hypothetical protein